MLTVKQARNLAELTQEEIARKMGIDVDTYRRIELSPEKATIERAKMFCKIVNKSIDQIFFDRNSTESREGKTA